MHVRLSTCIGTPVLDETTEQSAGTLSSILIHPDQGTIEGIFVTQRQMLHTQTQFVAVTDVLHWGTHIRIRDMDALSDLSERIRLQAFVDEGRTVLGQRLMTVGGVYLGVCKDVQFNTHTFVLEWLFPRLFLRWGIALPVSVIVEVKPDAIIVRETAAGIEEKTPILQTLEELAKTPTAGMAPFDELRVTSKMSW